MLRRYRQRRGPYALARPSVVPSLLRRIIVVVVLLLVAYYLVSWVLGLFSVGNNVQRSAAMLDTESRGTVNVSLDGGLLQRAEDGLKLYPGDRVTTATNSHARVTFFDGTVVRFDESSDATIVKSEEGSKESAIELRLEKGAAWFKTPTRDTFSGSIMRSVIMPAFTLLLPSDAQVFVDGSTLLVFSDDGNGVVVRPHGTDEEEFEITVSEGQQLALPDQIDEGESLTAFRSAIDPFVTQRAFVRESRSLLLGKATSPTSATEAGEEILTVTSPKENALVAGSTVKVQGRVSSDVARVRVNSYQAIVDTEEGTFTQELSWTGSSDTMSIHIVALDQDGITLAEEERTVRKSGSASGSIPTPTITSPAKTGETHRTQQTEFAISGAAPTGAAGIMVNEYRLQLFRPGDTTWSYLASTSLNNLKPGTNVYNVYTLDEAGNKSAPATITIVLGDETATTSSTASSGAGSVSSDESTLPQNSPLAPGTLSVTGPTAGATHTQDTGTGFLLEGTTSAQTESVWINGYRLQLFKPGNTYWNYIADTKFGNLKRGKNLYKVVARNEDDQILDIFEYTVEFNP